MATLCSAVAAMRVGGSLLPQPASTACPSQRSSTSGLTSSFTASRSVAPSLSCSFAVARPICHVSLRGVVTRAMADKAVAAPVKKKEDSAKKRARLAEDRRVYNKSRKTEIKTRMKKVFLALDKLKKSGAGSSEEIKPIEKLIAEAYSIIDKSVKVGTLHRNTGGNRKSRLARAKRAVEIQLGLYTPAPTA